MPVTRIPLLLFAAGLALAGCSRSAFIELDNRSGHEIAVESRDGTAWRVRGRVPAGEVVGRIPLGVEMRLKAGTCTYTYAEAAWVSSQPRREPGGLGPPYSTYLLRLEADFTLHLFNATEEGQIGTEVESHGWPAKPAANCSDSG